MMLAVLPAPFGDSTRLLQQLRHPSRQHRDCSLRLQLNSREAAKTSFLDVTSIRRTSLCTQAEPMLMQSGVLNVGMMHNMVQVPRSKSATLTAPAMRSQVVATRATTTLWRPSQQAACLPSLQMGEGSMLPSRASLRPAVWYAQHQCWLRASRISLVPHCCLPHQRCRRQTDQARRSRMGQLHVAYCRVDASSEFLDFQRSAQHQNKAAGHEYAWLQHLSRIGRTLAPDLPAHLASRHSLALYNHVP